MSLELRFRLRFTEGDKDSCWNWEKGVTAGGYGQMAYHNKKYSAHRLAWTLHHGKDIPDGKVIRHTCDNPRCVNPHHLLIGTQSDNVKDMIERGRLVVRSRPKGEENPNSIVKEIHVKDIYEMNGSHIEIATKFNYPVGAIRSIRSGRTWRYITKELNPGERAKPGAKGELNGKATVDNEMVSEIYQSKFSNTELSKKYLCSLTAIQKIKTGKTWRHVTSKLTKG